MGRWARSTSNYENRMNTITNHVLAARHRAVCLCAALGMKVQQTPHLLAKLTAAGNLLLAVHCMSKQLPDFAAAGAATVGVGAAACMHQQLHCLLKLLCTLYTFLLSETCACLIHTSIVGVCLQTWTHLSSWTPRDNVAIQTNCLTHYQSPHNCHTIQHNSIQQGCQVAGSWLFESQMWVGVWLCMAMLPCHAVITCY